MQESVQHEDSPIFCKRLKASFAHPVALEESSVGVRDAEELCVLRSVHPCSPERLERMVLGADPVAGRGRGAQGLMFIRLPAG